jgi:protein TonB
MVRLGVKSYGIMRRNGPLHQRSNAARSVLSGSQKPVRPMWTARHIWIAAACGAFALHVGSVVFVVTIFRTVEPVVELGAPGQLTAPVATPSSLPAGPDTQQSVDAIQSHDESRPVPQKELPPPPNVTDQSTLVVAPDKPKPTPTHDRHVKPPRPKSEASSAQATANSGAETARQAQRSVTQAQGFGESKQLVRSSWQREMMAYIEQHKRYPADRGQQSAQITVRFSLDRTGRMLSKGIVRGSGDPSFDAAAMSMLQRSDPVPPPPPLIADENLSFTLPIVFRGPGHG